MGTLDSKRVLITGAASGIGRATALLFAREGARVALADRDAVNGQAVAQAIIQEGAHAIFMECDVTRAEDCRRAVEKTVEGFGGLDVVLNNAGIVRRSTVVTLDEADWDLSMAVNVKSAFLISKYAIPVMQANGGGSVINMASGWGLVGGPQAVAYCASKGAIVLLTKAMAIDFGPDNIRVNCLCPGDTDTDMLRREAKQLGQSEAAYMAAAADRPLRRVGRPEEIAQAALFLASDASSYVTGSALVVDGGGLAGG